MEVPRPPTEVARDGPAGKSRGKGGVGRGRTLPGPMEKFVFARPPPPAASPVLEAAEGMIEHDVPSQVVLPQVVVDEAGNEHDMLAVPVVVPRLRGPRLGSPVGSVTQVPSLGREAMEVDGSQEVCVVPQMGADTASSSTQLGQLGVVPTIQRPQRTRHLTMVTEGMGDEQLPESPAIFDDTPPSDTFGGAPVSEFRHGRRMSGIVAGLNPHNVGTLSDPVTYQTSGAPDEDLSHASQPGSHDGPISMMLAEEACRNARGHWHCPFPNCSKHLNRSARGLEQRQGCVTTLHRCTYRGLRKCPHGGWSDMD